MIFFATTNAHKIKEVEAILGISLLSYKKGEEPNIIENGNSFFENALIKARASYQLVNVPVLCEDSGIIVPTLNGAPGIHSARYAGENANDKNNRQKLLIVMKEKQSRDAYYNSTFIYLYYENGVEKIYHSTGELWGRLSYEEKGGEGFGYDSIFIPKGYEKTLAELGDEVKNTLSHRTIAINKLKPLLKL